MTLRVVSHITPESGMEEELIAVLPALIAPTYNEDCYASYGLLRDIERGHFAFIEEWTSEQFAEGLDVQKYDIIN